MPRVFPWLELIRLVFSCVASSSSAVPYLITLSVNVSISIVYITLASSWWRRTCLCDFRICCVSFSVPIVSLKFILIRIWLLPYHSGAFMVLKFGFWKAFPSIKSGMLVLLNEMQVGLFGATISQLVSSTFLDMRMPLLLLFIRPGLPHI